MKNFGNFKSQFAGLFALFAFAGGMTAPDVANTFISDADVGPFGHFRFYGRWEHVRHLHDGRFSDSSSRSASPGSLVTFSFTGRVVRLYGVRGPGGGTGILTIDGKHYPDLDFYATSKLTRIVVFSSPLLPAGKHVVAIATEGDRHDTRHRSSYVNISGASFG